MKFRSTPPPPLGRPVDRVLLAAATVALAFSLSLASPLLAGSPSCESAELNLIFQKAPVDSAGHQTRTLFANATESIGVGVPRGEVGGTRVWGAIVSRVAGQRGVEGWAIQARTRGDIRVVDATVEGTAGALEPDGLLRDGFLQVRVPTLREESGFYSAVVLSFTQPVALRTTGTATVIAATVEAASPQGADPIEGSLEWVDGCVGCAEPFLISASVGGRKRFFCSRAPLVVRFLEQTFFRSRFVRCDTTGDGRLTITDPVSIVNRLFSGQPDPSCRDVEDCDGDLRVNLTDVIYGLNFLFNGGPPPPTPFPDCGRPGQTMSATSCAAGSSACRG